MVDGLAGYRASDGGVKKMTTAVDYYEQMVGILAFALEPVC